jgi:NTE family protein
LTFGPTSSVATNFGPQNLGPLRNFCSSSIDAAAIGEGYLPGLLKAVTGGLSPLPDVSAHIETHYRNLFGGPLTLQNIPDRPRFVFNVTNFAIGVDFRFSRPRAGYYRIGHIPNSTVTIAFAVTCSSAFPPVLFLVMFRLIPRSSESGRAQTYLPMKTTKRSYF